MTDTYTESRPDADDWRAYFDSSILRVWHLPQGRDWTVRIVDLVGVEGEMFVNGKKQKMKQPKLTLRDKSGPVALPFLPNKTICKTIQRMYGKNPKGWVGHLITLYATTTERQGETVDCIRVRPEPPHDPKAGGAPRDRRSRAAALPPPVAPQTSGEGCLLPGDENEPPFGVLETDGATVT
jgi:hypothetical protein